MFVHPVKSTLMLFIYSYAHLGKTTINFEHRDRWLSRHFANLINQV